MPKLRELFVNKSIIPNFYEKLFDIRAMRVFMKSLSFINQKFLVILYCLSFMFSCQQILAESKCKKDNIFYSILDETGLSNLFYTLNFSQEMHPISSELEPFEYISKAINHRCIDVEVLLDKLKNLAMQDTQSFNELSAHINSDAEFVRILTEETKNNPYQRLKLSLVRNNIPLEPKENDSFDSEFESLFKHIYWRCDFRI